MKIKLIYSLIIASLLLISQISLASPASAFSASASKVGCHHCENSANLSIFIDIPAQPDDADADSIVEDEDYPTPTQVYHCFGHNNMHWLPMHFGDPLPRHVVRGGSQPYPPARLYVCRGFYNGGVHPGKLFQGHCNIGWGGNEIVLNQYEVLTSRCPLRWISASHGYVPLNAIRTGYQHDGPLYTCRVWYRGGLHPGKVVNGNCNIGWGGQEISIPVYEILAR